ncbi:MAG: dienelactone hydrolase family protein [Deltaproteobacteria bacterium]|jgi:dienelactone hydrolase
MERILVAVFALLLIVGVAAIVEAAPKVTGKTVEYSVQGVVMKGYLTYDEHIHGKRPGVLVVHEWWGVNDYVRRRARMLAELGYAALAVDMYGGKVATTPADAQKFAGEIRDNFDLAKARFMAGMDFLKGQSIVDPTRIAAIGYCFGGGIVLNMALEGVDLKGVVSFHGGLASVKPAQKGAVKAKILVLHGEADTTSTPEQVAAFKKEMDAAGADYRFISYPGAKHAFTNPDADAAAREYNLPIGYNAAADKQSWEEMKTFFKEIFAE